MKCMKLHETSSCHTPNPQPSMQLDETPVSSVFEAKEGGFRGWEALKYPIQVDQAHWHRNQHIRSHLSLHVYGGFCRAMACEPTVFM